MPLVDDQQIEKQQHGGRQIIEVDFTVRNRPTGGKCAIVGYRPVVNETGKRLHT